MNAPTTTPTTPSTTNTPPNAGGAPDAQKPVAGNGANGSTPAGGAPHSDAQKLTSAADAAIKKYKLTVDGKDEEIDEPELIRRAQKATGADKRFHEAFTTKQQVEDLVKRMRDKGQVWDVLKVLGHDPRKVAEDYLLNVINEEKLTPEQKAVRQAQEIIKRDEERRKTEEMTAHQRRQEELKNRYTQEYSQQIISALQKHNLPKSEFTVRQMAYFMHQGLKKGVSLTADDVAPLVRNHFMKQITDVLGATDEDTLLNLMGEPIAEKLRKADLKRLQNPKPPVPAGEQPKGGPSTPSNKRKTLSMSEFQEQNERLKRTGSL